MPDRQQQENLAKAIGVMTAWENDPPGENRDFVGNIAAQYLTDPYGVEYLVSGLMSLAGLLLVRLEKTTGTSANDTLRDIARRYTT